MRKPVVVWVDGDTEEVLVEEYISVSSGELTDATHMELTHDQVLTVPDGDQLSKDMLEAVEIVEMSGWSHRHAVASRLRQALQLGEEFHQP